MTTVDLDFTAEYQIGEGEQQLNYNIRGTENEGEAYFSLIANAIPIYNGRFAYSAVLRRVATECYVGTVSYKAGTPEQRQSFGEDGGGSSLQFELGNETQHITQSLSTVSSTTSGGRPAADHKGAIGVSSDGIEGTDILVPTMNWSETHYYPLASIGPSYLSVLKATRLKMNSASFRNFAKGEVLFLGASGGVSASSPRWEITYRFAQSDNVTSLAVGDITVPSKLGWDYLWIEYIAQSDDTAKAVARVPYAAYVERVYEFADYSQLRLNS